MDYSHLVTVPQGIGGLSDIISQSPILSDGMGGGGVNLNEFGVDPEQDPDLAMVPILKPDFCFRTLYHVPLKGTPLCVSVYLCEWLPFD